MPIKIKAAGRATQAAYRNVQSYGKSIRSGIKAGIISLTCRRVVPIKLMDWIIHHGGLHHD